MLVGNYFIYYLCEELKRQHGMMKSLNKTIKQILLFISGMALRNLTCLLSYK